MAKTMVIDFIVQGKPQGKGRHRSAVTSSGKLRTYTPQKTVRYEKDIAQAFRIEACSRRLVWPLDRVAWQDDRQVTFQEVKKMYVKEYMVPCIHVYITTIDAAPEEPE